MIERLKERGVPSAGLFAGPLAWLASTQANYSLTGMDCAVELPIVLILSLILVAISLCGGLLSWRAWRAGDERALIPWKDGRPHRFIAAIGIATAALFALVILLQGAAGLFLSGCER